TTTPRSWSSSTTSRSRISRRWSSRPGWRARRRSSCADTWTLGRELGHVLLERGVGRLYRPPRRGMPRLGLGRLVLRRPARGVRQLLLERRHGQLGLGDRL